MVTPSAEVRAPRRLTPDMQLYCVMAFRASVKTCFGTKMENIDGGMVLGPHAWGWPVLVLFEPGTSDWIYVDERWSGGDDTKSWNWSSRER